MTLLIACILLWQFDWPWYWYPISAAVWCLHEYHSYSSFKRIQGQFDRLYGHIDRLQRRTGVVKKPDGANGDKPLANEATALRSQSEKDAETEPQDVM